MHGANPALQCSIGLALADTLDDLISSRRIEPQLAIKIMNNFDQMIAQVLGERVKARMSFKVAPSFSTIILSRSRELKA